MVQLLPNSAHTASRALFLSLSPQQVGWGWAGGWEETQRRQMTHTDQGVLCAIKHHAQQQHWGNVYKRATVQRPAGHHSAGGKWWVSAFASPFCLHFKLPSYSFFLFWFSPPSAAEGNEQGAGGCLVVWQSPPQLCNPLEPQTQLL